MLANRKQPDCFYFVLYIVVSLSLRLLDKEVNSFSHLELELLRHLMNRWPSFVIFVKPVYMTCVSCMYSSFVNILDGLRRVFYGMLLVATSFSASVVTAYGQKSCSHAYFFANK